MVKKVQGPASSGLNDKLPFFGGLIAAQNKF